ncbi:uncharacterized protein LOC124690011 [Lolium rigidum]|uniref:uncharacterized protein LOC124690011 n=1 Tax=Lolium rigidum TaxID=89674 RepID=UPI001F5DA2BD|nr:uncharacterized protein LOC124690011 [Lolium rigidum]
MNGSSRSKTEKKRVVPTIGAFMVDYCCEEKQDERTKIGRRSAGLGDGRDNDTINSRDEGHVSSSLCSSGDYRARWSRIGASATRLSPPHSQQPPPASMDPHGADLPCIVQALASMDPNDAAERPCIVQALAASPSKPQAAFPAAAAAGDHPTPPAPNSSRTRATSPRRTRSGGAPEWTAAETLALVATVAAVDDDGWARSVSAFQKWAIVADNLASSAGPSSRRKGRAAGECKRRWEALVAEYGAVRRAGGRYWGMGAAARRKAGLPEGFDAEVYGIMDALIQVEEAFLAGAGGGGGGEGSVGAGGAQPTQVRKEESGDAGLGEEEEEEEMQVDGGDANAPQDLDAGAEAHNKHKKSQTDAWELANKLNENAQHIHMLLNGEANEEAGQNRVPGDGISPEAMETTRQKADELIKSLGGLVSYLNQFTDLIKENGIEDVVGVN